MNETKRRLRGAQQYAVLIERVFAYVMYVSWTNSWNTATRSMLQCALKTLNTCLMTLDLCEAFLHVSSPVVGFC
jgi:hypothetical protein